MNPNSVAAGLAAALILIAGCAATDATEAPVAKPSATVQTVAEQAVAEQTEAAQAEEEQTVAEACDLVTTHLAEAAKESISDGELPSTDEMATFASDFKDVASEIINPEVREAASNLATAMSDMARALAKGGSGQAESNAQMVANAELQELCG